MLKELYEQARVLEGGQAWPTYDGGELDRTSFLTSSEVSRCLRMSFFAKYPEKFPLPVGRTGNNGFAERGHAIEAFFVQRIKALEAIGYEFSYMGKEQRSFYDADTGISGTPDGLMKDPNGNLWLLELKSIDPRFNKNNLPKKGHVPQTIQNMHLVEKCLNVKLAGGILFYIDASDVWDVREFPVEFDQKQIEINLARAEELWDAQKPEDLEAEGVYSGDCDICPFTHHCSQSVSMQKMLAKAKDAAGPFLESLEETPLKADEKELIESFLTARAAAAEKEKEKDAVADEVKRIVMDHDGLVKTGGVLMFATMSPGRNTIDKTLLVAAGLDPDAFTKAGKPFVTLTVKQ